MGIENKKWMVIMPIVLSMVLIFGMLIGKLMNSGNSDKQFIIYPQTDKFSAVLNYIEERYVDTVDKNALIEKIIPELLLHLDPHSIYIPASDLQEMNEPLEGNFEGIGVQFNVRNDTIIVINTIPGGPSELKGIMAGDRIVRIDDTLFTGPKLKSDDVVKRLKGKGGTHVKLGIARKGVSELIFFDIVRGKIPLYSVDVSYMINETTGYVKINKFSRTTYEEFVVAVHKLLGLGMKEIIVDLRGNGGGYMDAATNIVDEFLTHKELIVYTEGRAQPRSSTMATKRDLCKDLEVVVIMDEWSASASEILAGALQDNDRGTIVGRRSFGKGLVQEPTVFTDGSALRLTIARYYTPTGRCIQKSYGSGTDDYYLDIGQRYTHGEFDQKDSISFNDSLKYYTPSGKVVYGGGGIMPDVFVPVDTNGASAYLTDVARKGLVYRFAFEYVDKNRQKLSPLKSAMEISDYLDKQNILNKFIVFAEKEGVNENDHDIKISGMVLSTQLKAFISRNLINDEGYYPIISKIDNTLQKAIETLMKKRKSVIGNR